nr:ATP synthase F0 subunit 8 [Galeruca sp. EMHAU-15083109]
MPQMMPLNWVSLMLFFILIFILFNQTNYFNFLYKTKTLKTSMKSTSYNWKW